MGASGSVKAIFGTKIAVKGITFVGGVLLARALGTEGRGLLGFALTLVNVGFPIISLSFGGGALYEISRKRYLLSEVFLTSILVGAIFALAGGAGLTLLWSREWLGASGASIDRSIILMLDIIFLLHGVGWILNRIYLGSSEYRLVNMTALVTSVVTVAGYCLLYTSTQLTLVSACVSIIAGKLASIVCFVIFRIRECAISFSVAFVRDAFRYGVKSWVGVVAGIGNRGLDALLLGFLVGPAQLGLYLVARGIAEFVGTAMMSLNPVLHNKIAGDGTRHSRIQLMCRIHRLVVLLGIICLIGVGLVGWLAIPLVYTAEFVLSKHILVFYLPGMLALFSSQVISRYFCGIGKVFIVTKMQLFSFGFGFILYPLLIHIGGIVGAACASSTIYWIRGVWAFYFLRKEVGNELEPMFRISGDDIRWLSSRIFPRFFSKTHA
jgi:teichuronic acid exporter